MIERIDDDTKLNRFWGRDMLKNCFGKLCFDETWGYFVIDGVCVKAEFEPGWAIFRKNDGYVYIYGGVVVQSDSQDVQNGTLYEVLRGEFYGVDIHGGRMPFPYVNGPMFDGRRPVNVVISPDIVTPTGYGYECKMRSSGFGCANVEPGSIKDMGGARIYGQITGEEYLSGFRFDTVDECVEAVRGMLDRKVLVCDDATWWRQESVAGHHRKCVGDNVYYRSRVAEILKFNDDGASLRLRFGDGEEEDVALLQTDTYELPTYRGEKYDEEIDRERDGHMLSPYVELGGGVLNVCWDVVPEAASYRVTLYKEMPAKGRPAYTSGIVKMKEYELGRNDGFLSVGGLVGNGFIVKVRAEDREGNVISECRGTRASGNSSRDYAVR